MSSFLCRVSFTQLTRTQTSAQFHRACQHKNLLSTEKNIAQQKLVTSCMKLGPVLGGVGGIQLSREKCGGGVAVRQFYLLRTGRTKYFHNKRLLWSTMCYIKLKVMKRNITLLPLTPPINQTITRIVTSFRTTLRTSILYFALHLRT